MLCVHSFSGTLVVQHYSPSEGLQASEMSALDVATGTRLWHHAGIDPLWRMGRPLRVVGGRVPVLIPPPETQYRTGTNIRMAMVDIRSGAFIGADVAKWLADQLHHFNGDFEVFRNPGRIVVGTANGVYVFEARDGISHGEDSASDE